MRRISPHVSPIRPRIAPTGEPRTSASPPRPAPSSPPESPPPTYPAHRTNRRILALALPTFGQLIAEPVFILIDTAIVGHIGDDALAGLSIGSTIMLTTVGLCVFLAYGTTSQVAHLIGAGKRREGLETGIDGMWLALAIGLAVGAAILLASTPLCMAMGGRGAVLDNAVAYVRTIVLGLPGMLVVYAANGIFRGLGRVRLTLIAAVSGAVINTVLDVIFVFHLRWGIAGSGLATFLAQWCMALILVVPALRWARQAGARWVPRLGGILGTARNGIPLFVRTLALRISMAASHHHAGDGTRPAGPHRGCDRRKGHGPGTDTERTVPGSPVSNAGEREAPPHRSLRLALRARRSPSPRYAPGSRTPAHSPTPCRHRWCRSKRIRR